MTTEEELPLFTHDRTQGVKIRMGESGIAAKPPKTVMQVFHDTVKERGDYPALHQKIVKKGMTASETEWTTWSWNDYQNQVHAFAKSLLSIGFEPFDCINIIGFNSPEWAFSYVGAIVAGGIAAGIYTTNLPDACKYISSHSKAKVVVVEGTNQLEKFIQIAPDLPDLKALVMYGTDELPSDIKERCPSVSVYTYADFVKIGKDISDTDLQSRMDEQKPNQVCSLIYTSGTTGPPKAVMITHDNITWTTQAMTGNVSIEVTKDDHMVSYLPFSHIAALLLDVHVCMMAGGQLWFAQPDALRGSLGATLKEVRPTFFFGVPRVWEKIYEKMQEVSKATTGLKKSVATWAKSTALAHHEANEYGSTSAEPWFYYASQFVLHQVLVALGLDRCKACFTSAAPIETKILKYFFSIDLPIYEGFGQSECTGPHTWNFPDAWKIGTVGRPLIGTETVVKEDTGELCYRGRHIFAGYMDMKEKTEETVDAEGWLHSGDIVKIDDCNNPDVPGASGFVSITGRIKELIITAGGENVPPVLIEEMFKQEMPALSNCMVIGDKRKFLSILLCLFVEIDEDGVASDKLTGSSLDVSKEIGSSATTTAEVKECAKWKEYFDKGMKAANAQATSRAQKVAKWDVIATDFTEKGGELTPTLKLKRSVAAEKYKNQIDAMYA